MSLFEKATRLKLRFPSSAGNLNVEDLWDLPLKSERTNRASLNNVAQLANAKVKANEEESFVDAPSPGSTVDQLRLDVVKHVIAVRIEENKAKTEAAANRAHNAKIDALIEKKQDEALAGKSIEELQALKK